MLDLDTPVQRRLTVKQVAELLQVRTNTVYRWARTGYIPCIRVRRKALRFDYDDIKRWERTLTTGKL